MIKVLIAHRDTALRLARELVEPHVVALPQGFALIPWTDTLTPRPDSETQHAGRTGTGDGPEALLTILLEISREGPIVSASTDYFGGRGSQRAEVFRDGEREVVLCEEENEGVLRGPLFSGSPINRALRCVGVVRVHGLDEFDTMRLGSHRFTEGWFKESSLSPEPVEGSKGDEF